MPDLRVVVNGREMQVAKGTTVAAVLLQVAVPCRTSISGEPRTALCGMGICFECRAIVDGVAHRLTCQTMCVEGMTVESMTGGTGW